MLADDGRLVFLDFGLMSRVDENIMEAFASGIQCVLSKDYEGLVRSAIRAGFTPVFLWNEALVDLNVRPSSLSGSSTCGV